MEEYLKSIINVPFEVSPVDNMHICIKKSDVQSIKEIVKQLNTKFPWAMVYNETNNEYFITLC